MFRRQRRSVEFHGFVSRHQCGGADLRHNPLVLAQSGEDTSIGRVGSLGGGITGILLGDAGGENCRFIARKTSKFQLVQEPVKRGLKDVRKI